MPAAFLKCVKEGGKVRTKALSNGRYMHICFKGGKSYAGEVKVKQTHHSAPDGKFIDERKRRFNIL